MSKKTKLKPCPFCGENLKISNTGIRHKCSMDSEHDTVRVDISRIDDFIKKWNRRPLEEELLDALKIVLPHIQCENYEQSGIITMVGELIAKTEECEYE